MSNTIDFRLIRQLWMFLAVAEERNFTKAAARLRHPNIVAVFESGKAGDDYFIVSEFVQGEPLSVRMAESRPNFQTAVRWVHDIAEGLGYAHTEDEYFVSDISTAAAITNAHGRGIGAVNIAVARSRWQADRDEKRFADLVISTASAISTRRRIE